MLEPEDLITGGVGFIQGFQIPDLKEPFVVSPGITLSKFDLSNEDICHYVESYSKKHLRNGRRKGIFILFSTEEERKPKWGFEFEQVLWNLELALLVLTAGTLHSPGAICHNKNHSPKKYFSPIFTEDTINNHLLDIVLQNSDLPQLADVYKKIAYLNPLDQVDSKGFSRLRNALRFFNQGVKTHWFLLKIVMFFISLESLFSDQNDSSDISYKVRLRAARIIGEDKEMREEIFDDLKLGYEIRSKYLHGANVASRVEKGHPKKKGQQFSMISDYPEVLEKYTRKILLKIMTDTEMYKLFSEKTNEKREKDFFNNLVL